MNNTIHPGLAFRAKMDLAEVYDNRAKWLRVAKIFEKKTSKYPKDEICLRDTNDKGNIDFYVCHANPKLDTEDVSTIRSIVVNILKLLPDEMVAEKLKKIFLIQKKADIMEAENRKFDIKYKLYRDLDEELVDKYANAYYDIKNDFIKKQLEKDDVLKIPDGVLIL